MADETGKAKPKAAPEAKKETKEEVMARLKTSPEGLTQQEAEKRLAESGPNELPEEKRNALLNFLKYFWSPIPWMIEAAAVLSALVGDWTDFTVIMILLIVNGLIGWWEESKADDAIEALKKQLALEAAALRDGKWVTLAARELVEGDVVRLRLGEIVPADAVLLDGDPVQIDQSALTGESLAVTRGPGETVYSGSTVKQGETRAVVSGTGANTYFGRTASLIEEVHTVSHFQRAVLRIGDYLIILAIALVLVIIFTALFRHEKFVTVLQFCLVLTVAAIPVAMPTVLSVTMAVGSRLLSRKQAIVRRLAAIEEMAGLDILCSDKTGTLTKNELTLGDPFLLQGVSRDDVILAAALASHAENPDAIDHAIMEGLGDVGKLKAYTVTHFRPFDPVHKRTEADVKDGQGQTFKVTKGAPQVILGMVANRDAASEQVNAKVTEFAGRGFRSLGVARTDASGQWQLLGVLSLFDPPRDDSASTIASAQHMGLRVKMVTGDQLAIAKETAKELGLGPNIMEASIFSDSEHHEVARVNDAVERADGFAEVFPEHKYHIVDVLQKRGHIVGMTGDGVNDAPALKKADAGIAVSGATDAARSAADIVLLTPGLSVIIDAIRESRRIFARMNSYTIYRIAETIAVLLFMAVSILAFKFYPMTAVMIVLLALLNDGAILSIAYDRAEVAPAPQAWNMRRVLGIASIMGVYGVFESFGLLYLGRELLPLKHHFADAIGGMTPADFTDRFAATMHRELFCGLTPVEFQQRFGVSLARVKEFFGMAGDKIQGLVYLQLSIAGHLTVFCARTRGPFWSTRPAWIVLLAVIATQLVATFIVVYGLFDLMPAIGWPLAGLVWVYCLILFIVQDWVKLLGYRVFGDGKGVHHLHLAKVESRAV